MLKSLNLLKKSRKKSHKKFMVKLPLSRQKVTQRNGSALTKTCTYSANKKFMSKRTFIHKNRGLDYALLPNSPNFIENESQPYPMFEPKQFIL